MSDPEDVLPEDELPTNLTPYVEKLADEGVPIRALARSFARPAPSVRDVVQTAIHDGRIIQMPKDDWPIGQSRGDRAPVFVRHNRMDDESLLFSCQRLFKVTRLQASLLTVLLVRNEVSKITMHQVIESRRPPGKEETNLKMVDVVICHLRTRLRPYNLEIKTQWGSGYFMAPQQRKRILEMVNDYVLGKIKEDGSPTDEANRVAPTPASGGNVATDEGEAERD